MTDPKVLNNCIFTVLVLHLIKICSTLATIYLVSSHLSHSILLQRTKEIMNAVTIPVMAKARIGHFAEAQILEAIGVDMIDESEGQLAFLT